MLLATNWSSVVREPTMQSHKFFHDETERRKWQNPEKILAEIGLSPGQTFVDVGCGEGFFTIPAAKLLGKRGRVYGFDIDEKAIQRLKEKTADEGLENLILKVGTAEEVVPCRGCADFVFFGMNLHDFRDPPKALINAKKMLKSGARLIDLDWKKEPMDLGPPLRIRFSQEEAVTRIEEAGFRVHAVKQEGPYHYLIIAKA
jgi:ubiquinone/menaquinone biosynthesis C-methylase UbiE